MKALFERWGERETNSLREVYAILDKEELQERYGRPIENIRYKAKKLNAPKKRKPRTPWTPAEDRFLSPILFSPSYSTVEYSELLGRSRRAIESRVRKLRAKATKRKETFPSR